MVGGGGLPLTLTRATPGVRARAIQLGSAQVGPISAKMGKTQEMLQKRRVGGVCSAGAGADILCTA